METNTAHITSIVSRGIDGVLRSSPNFRNALRKKHNQITSRG